MTIGKNKQKVRCYTPDQMKKMYPNDDFNLAGETRYKNKEDMIASLAVGDENFVVSNPGSNKKLIYKTSGYVTVADDTYVAILTNRFLFLIILFLILAGVIAAVAIAINLLLTPVEEPPPVNPAPEPEPMATPIEDDDTAKDRKEASRGSGSIRLQYTLEATLHLSEGSIDMSYKNPGMSNQNAVLSLYIVSGDTEVLIAESGAIEPGYELTHMGFIENSAVLSPGKYKGRYSVFYYDPDTGERAMISPSMEDVVIEVVE
ncbi:MAG: hypothetical protein J1E40_00800 [Oscillospiraceae bacterium]|nr:hypothetical protein [Oscillospiraceae bacterium]